eukprot:Clim_evm3s44 gene=Clim_evmTU3s44
MMMWAIAFLVTIYAAAVQADILVVPATKALWNGRVRTDDNHGTVSFDWSCVNGQIFFSGAEQVYVKYTAPGADHVFTAMIKNTSSGNSHNQTWKGEGWYRPAQRGIFDNLDPSQQYSVTFYKEIEPNYKVGDATAVIFHDFELHGPAPKIFYPPLPKLRNVEIYGDSDSVGFGILGKNVGYDMDPCLQDKNLFWSERCTIDWVETMKSILNVNTRVTAISGIGVYRNIPLTGGMPVLPALFKRTLASDGEHASDEDLSGYPADVVVVYVGGNDYTVDPDKFIREGGDEKFMAAYESFTKALLDAYAPQKPKFLHICGGGQPEAQLPCPRIEKVVESSFSHHRFINISQERYSQEEMYTCSHRGVNAQTMLGRHMADVIGDMLDEE